MAPCIRPRSRINKEPVSSTNRLLRRIPHRLKAPGASEMHRRRSPPLLLLCCCGSGHWSQVTGVIAVVSLSRCVRPTLRNSLSASSRATFQVPASFQSRIPARRAGAPPVQCGVAGGVPIVPSDHGRREKSALVRRGTLADRSRPSSVRTLRRGCWDRTCPPQSSAIEAVQPSTASTTNSKMEAVNGGQAGGRRRPDCVLSSRAGYVGTMAN